MNSVTFCKRDAKLSLALSAKRLKTCFTAKRMFEILSFFCKKVHNNKKLKDEKFKQYQYKSLFFLGDSSGVAMVELLPFVVLILVLVSLTFGLWSSIHAGTLGSIAARHYAFEVMNNRSNFNCHRDTVECIGTSQYYKKMGYRFFAVVKEDQPPPPALELKLKRRPINLFEGFNRSFINKTQFINNNPPSGGPLPPLYPKHIRLKQGYGICVNCNCGNRPTPGIAAECPIP